MSKNKIFKATSLQKSALTSVSIAIAKATNKLNDLNEQNRTHDTEIIAEIILTAFAIESLLKALHTYSNPNKEYPSVHNLKDLFDSIPPTTKQAVSDAFFEFNNKKKNLDAFLSEHANIFVDWRYIWEKNSTEACSANLREMRIFMSILLKIIESISG